MTDNKTPTPAIPAALSDPLRNRGVAFTPAERDALGLAELLPVVYDPTVGEAIEKYSNEYRRPRGIFLSIDRPDDMAKAFATLALEPGDVDLIVCSDAEQILGIGDWASAESRSPSASSPSTRPCSATMTGCEPACASPSAS